MLSKIVLMNYLKIASGVMVSASIICSCNTSSNHRRSGNIKTRSPNIILYFCDDLGYGDLGCYGSGIHRTPALDSLAKKELKIPSFSKSKKYNIFQYE